MNAEQLAREMRRKPDAYLIVEWLAEQATARTVVNADEARLITDAFFEAIEQE